MSDQTAVSAPPVYADGEPVRLDDVVTLEGDNAGHLVGVFPPDTDVEIKSDRDGDYRWIGAAALTLQFRV